MVNVYLCGHRCCGTFMSSPVSFHSIIVLCLSVSSSVCLSLCLLLIINCSVNGRWRRQGARLSRANTRPPCLPHAQTDHHWPTCMCVCVWSSRCGVARWWGSRQDTPAWPGISPRRRRRGVRCPLRDVRRRLVECVDRCGQCVVSGCLVACHPHSSHAAATTFDFDVPPHIRYFAVIAGHGSTCKELSTTGHQCWTVPGRVVTLLDQ